MEKGLFERAVAYAAEKHSGAYRKLDNSPYILHPMEVALIVSSMTKDEEVLAAAVLHDTVEDTDATIEEIEALFGPRTAALVASETEDKHPELPKAVSWRMRKEESIRKLKNASDPGVKLIWIGDKLSNLRALKRAVGSMGGSVWGRFNQKDPAQHEWYYRSIEALLGELSGSEAWKEYHGLIESLFSAPRDER